MTETQNLAGRKLGDYVLREKLTSGGMAHIYLGEDEKLQRRAAIKVLTSDLAGNDTILRERFEREARAIAQLEHDNIVPIYQFGEQDKLYFIAMRYIEGNDLADEMKKYKERGDKMPIERALAILGQVADALDHAHKRGIIHRDVKPSNILLRKQDGGGTGDKAVLSDFGLVLWEDVDKTLGTAFGTPRYISPEQATDSQSAVPQSDIYSLAVIVYEIVTGEVLFKGNTPMEVALSHITEPPTPPRAHNPSVPQNAQVEILKALQKDAAKRHKTARDFIDALKKAYNIDKPATSPTIENKPNRKAAAEPDTITKDVLEESWESIPSVRETKPPKGKKTPAPTPVVEVKTPEVKKVVNPRKADMDIAAKQGGKTSLPLPLPVLVGGGIAIVVIGIILFTVLNGGGAGGNPNPANANMRINYNENYFAIKNISENSTLDISNLNIVGASTEPVGRDFDTDTTLGPNECVFVKRGAVSDSDIPSSWACGGRARTTFQSNVFWRAENTNDSSFAVNNGSNLIESCNTVGIAVNNAGDNNCALFWPEYEINETETP